MSSVNHCLLCYKEGDSEFTLVTDSTGEGRRLVENEETSRKFLLLSCRYLNLDTNQIFPESQAFSGLSTLKQVCDGCFPLLESFCEMYEKWQLLQFEMNHKLEQIQKIMKQSDEDSTSHRKSWKTKLEKLNIASTSVDKFRSKFTGEIVRKRKNLPQVKVAAVVEPVPSKSPSGPTTTFYVLPDSSEVEMDVGEIEVKREIIFGDEPTSPHSQYTLGSPQVDLGEEESCEGNADDDQKIEVKKKTKKKVKVTKQHAPKNPRGRPRATATSTSVEISEQLNLTKGSPAKCPVCGKVFSRGPNLKRHLLLHSDTYPFMCGICGKGYVCRHTLAYHEASHGEKTFKCSHCDKSYQTQERLTMHERLHGINSPYKCKYCEKGFNGRKDLEYHERIHTGEKPFQCDECGKHFRGQNDLKLHKRVHTGIKPFECKICKKSFRQSGAARKHERSHVGEKPNQCKICGKCFNGSDILKKHTVACRGDQPYMCGFCGKRFSRPDVCRYHETHSHKEMVEPSQKNELASLPDEVKTLTNHV